MIEFSFDDARHEYRDVLTQDLYPSITQLLERGGLVETEWFTEAGRARGTWVHRVTADYDRGALTLAQVPAEHPWRNYVLAHMAAMAAIRPAFVAIEQARVHEYWKFGGRPDRVGTFYGLRGVLEIKSGAAAGAHAVQLALQAILEADRWPGLKPEDLARFCLYPQASAQWKLVEFRRRRDFDTAYSLLRQYAG